MFSLRSVFLRWWAQAHNRATSRGHRLCGHPDHDPRPWTMHFHQKLSRETTHSKRDEPWLWASKAREWTCFTGKIKNSEKHNSLLKNYTFVNSLSLIKQNHAGKKLSTCLRQGASWSSWWGWWWWWHWQLREGGDRGFCFLSAPFWGTALK
jgi:hypothetical protein